MRLLLLSLAFLPLCIFSQSPSLRLGDDGKYSFQKVIETNKSLDSNYTTVKRCIAYLYENANWVTKFDSKEQVITKGSFEVSHYKTYYIDHTLTVDIKDKKVRITINNLYLNDYDTKDIPFESKPNIFFGKSFWHEIKGKSLKTMIQMADFFEKELNKEPEDW